MTASSRRVQPKIFAPLGPAPLRVMVRGVVMGALNHGDPLAIMDLHRLDSPVVEPR